MALGKLGKYERVDVLGHGVSGIVYLAWDTLLRKQVALKEIDLQAADVSRFLEEARVMDRLKHPNIVRVNGVDLIESRVVIDMEYVKGGNLQELLRKVGRLPANRALTIAIQTLDALEFAHQLRTVHRDIKPANILVGPNDFVKLVDFGLAEILATNSYAGGAGTYAYMAPEDFGEEHRSDHQSDIWAIGITLYEMLTAARPFYVDKPKDPFAWRKTILHTPPSPLSDHMSDVPVGLESVLRRALSVDKRDRYDSAAAFRDDLIAIFENRVPVGARTSVVAIAYAGNGAGHSAIVQPRSAVASGGVLVAEPPVAPPRARPGLGSLVKPRENRIARAEAEPPSVYFGEVRKGEERTARVTVRLSDSNGRPSAALAGGPAWAVVSPLRFDRKRQTVTITARSAGVWQTGMFEDSVRLDTSAGRLDIPVAIKVLPARRRFSEIAFWFVPVFLSVLLPALTLAMATVVTHTPDARNLVPAAALASGLLAAMLLQVCRAADVGVEERIATGLILAVMCVVLGIVTGAAKHSVSTALVLPLAGTGVPIGLTALAQACTVRFWKLWAFSIVVLSLLASGTYLAALGG